MSQLNRRPFMDKIGTLGVSKKKTPKDATGAEETFKKCGKIWFTFWGGPPTFTELVQDMREEGVLSVKDATTDHYSSDGFLYGNSCIAIRGEFYR